MIGFYLSSWKRGSLSFLSETMTEIYLKVLGWWDFLSGSSLARLALDLDLGRLTVSLGKVEGISMMGI